MTEPQPYRCTVEKYGVSSHVPLPEDVQTDIENFMQRERQRVYEAKQQGEPYIELSQAFWNHAASWGNFNDQLGMASKNITPSDTADNGLLVIARDTETKEVLGFTSMLLRKSAGSLEAGDNYVGITADRKWRSYGLGGALVLLRDTALAEIGVQSYTADVWERSYQMYQRMGTPFTELSTSSDVLDTHGGSHRRLLVDLNSAALEHQCQTQLGVRQTSNVLMQPQEIALNPRHISQVVARTVLH